jgi:erythromycin esterase-like protein
VNDAVAVRNVARRLNLDASDYDGLLSLIGGARFVLIGEASHGTHEFYFERAQITKRLIAEKGFTVIAIEADWPDAYRVHRYIRGTSTDADADQALSGFRRFPTWMWRNTVVVEFIEWLRKFNSNLDSKNAAVGFYGMDLYSLHASMAEQFDAVIRLDETRALEPLERTSVWDAGELPETYPFNV